MILLRDILVLFTGAEELSGTDLLIDGTKISRIDDHIDPETLGNADIEVIDCSRMVVLPGFVNTHHHFYQTLQRCVPEVQDSPLFDWLTTLYEIWKNLDEDSVYWSTLVACGELLKTGCTTSTDHLYVFPTGSSSRFIDVEIEAASKIGIRFHPTRGSMSLGKDQGGLPPNEVVQFEGEILKDSERLIDEYHDPRPGSMLRIALAPCSPFSISERLLRETRELASKKGVLLHTHLAETEDENTYCLDKYGIRPVELMERCGWLGRDVWYAHGIHLTDAELDKLKATETGICHCPTSNMRLGAGRARVPEMLKMGIRVGLGVDGSASNDTSDMLAELRNCFLLQRLAGGSSAITTRQVIRLATSGGADLLGRDDIGTIKEDMCADIVGIDISDISHAGSLHDYLGSIVLCGSNHNVDLTIANGKVLVRNGRLLTVDEDEVVRKANEAARRLRDA
ncbi:MAG: 8-oxoguanine deaminase [Candidatus Eisenbacteria bacterium]